MNRFPSYQPLLTLPANLTGKDYIVGDLHGTAPLLLAHLQSLGFDFAHDRLFCTGDLVDRGGFSLATLRLLRESWFFSTLGNHERILLAKLGEPETGFFYSMTKLYSRWTANLTPDELSELSSLVPLIKAQPLVIQVAHSSHPFFVTHASRMVFTRQLTDDRLASFATQSFKSFLRTTTLSRRLALAAIHQFVRHRTPIDPYPSQSPAPPRLFVSSRPWEPKVGLTYVGHTVVPRLLLHHSHCFIDRGACFATQYPKRCALDIIDHAALINHLKQLKAI